MSQIRFLRDKTKRLRTDWENLKVGDYVFDDVNGPATGGITYGWGSIVTKITDTQIYTKYYDVYHWVKDKWSRKTKYHSGPPYAYFLCGFQSN